MQASFVSERNLDALLDPAGAAWRNVPRTELGLTGTPLGLQPTAAIKASWADKKIGAIDRVDVAALNDGQRLLFRLEWRDPTESRKITDNNVFVDGAAILFPTVPDAPLVLMGAKGAPVNVWYWRADEDAGNHIVAEGFGTTRIVDRDRVRTRAAWNDGRWQVVIARDLRVDSPEPVANVQPGAPAQFSIAVWDGANSERAGIKAFSPVWTDLTIEPAQR
ncbi:ethylbenzene dehydrogenase-related protein [Candidatus Binatia bacterium]|nr:ethylbenzene dehydrogenase-related protein [Candidatus Binatia bacterium]